MCGISAILCPAPDASLVAAMNDIIVHRGPDGSGICVDGQVALGHRRLAIVELSEAGAQPMLDGSAALVFNGEIYNHDELRDELRRLGFTFRGHSDTEVILGAYQAWGIDCLQRFNGMFAFILHDRRRRRIVAARDRYGIKPLYLWRSPAGLLAFASEIKQFSVLPGWSPAVDPAAAARFIASGILDDGDMSFFSGVRQVPGGSLLDIDETDLPLARMPQPRPWYVLPQASFDGGFDEAVAEFNRLFTDSVRLQNRADVAVGSCLSGGLDSSSIVTTVSELRSGSSKVQHTFTAASEDARLDESSLARLVAVRAGAEAAFCTPSGDELARILPHMAWHQDEPFGSSSIFAQWEVFRLAAASGVKVILDGQGADEMLFGYHRYQELAFRQLAADRRWSELLRQFAAVRRRGSLPLRSLVFGLLRPLLPAADAAYSRRHSGRFLLRPDGLAALPASPSPASPAELSRRQLLNDNLPMLLHWEDRNSMAHGIEARVPFLDHRLVEFALSLPDDFKLAAGVSKRVLRESMRGRLPEEVRDRRDKLGFATAELKWLRQGSASFRPYVEAALETAPQFFDAAAARHLWKDTLAGSRGFTFLPWRLVSFGAWLRAFNPRF